MTSKAFANATDANRQQGGRRNLIINGAMQVAQRGTSETGVTASGYYTVDRWQMNGNNGTWTIAQDTNTPDGFANSCKMTLTATEAIGSSSYMLFEQKVEGINLQSLAYGTSDAKTVTVSFYVKSNVTGTYCLNLYHDDGAKNFPKTYTIDSADTWEYKTISFVGDTSTALDNDNASSLRAMFFVVAGSSLNSGATGSRVAYTDATFAAGQSAQVDAVNDYWQITGVQLEVGDTATPFEHRSYGEELALCQRYYYQTLDSENSVHMNRSYDNSNQYYGAVQMPVTMRATPTFSMQTNTINLPSITNTTGTFSTHTRTRHSVIVQCAPASDAGAYTYTVVAINNSVRLDAEL